MSVERDHIEKVVNHNQTMTAIPFDLLTTKELNPEQKIIALIVYSYSINGVRLSREELEEKCSVTDDNLDEALMLLDLNGFLARVTFSI